MCVVARSPFSAERHGRVGWAGGENQRSRSQTPPVPPVTVGFVRCANPKRMDDVSLVELGSWNKDPR